jgi:hypothetical protein
VHLSQQPRPLLGVVYVHEGAYALAQLHPHSVRSAGDPLQHQPTHRLLVLRSQGADLALCAAGEIGGQGGVGRGGGRTGGKERVGGDSSSSSSSTQWQRKRQLKPPPPWRCTCTQDRLDAARRQSHLPVIQPPTRQPFRQAGSAPTISGPVALDQVLEGDGCHLAHRRIDALLQRHPQQVHNLSTGVFALRGGKAEVERANRAGRGALPGPQAVAAGGRQQRRQRRRRRRR